MREVNLEKLTQKPEKLGISLIVLVITLIGAAIRIFLVKHYDFPLNDGGLFKTMVNDIIGNGYRLPAFTTYNHAQIPFAYPPLPFYVVIFLHKVFNIGLISIFHYFPVICSILSIPAFYKLSSAILNSDVQLIHATFAFSIAAPAIEWNIMGGGVTRSLGYLFSILALYHSVLLFKIFDVKRLVYSIIFLSLTGYCHLEVLFVTIIFITVIYLFSEFVDTFTVYIRLLLGTFLLFSPYIIRTMYINGYQTLISAFQSGDFNLLNSIGKFLLSNLTGEYLFTPILVIAMIAFVRLLIRHEYFLPILTLVPIFANPRSMERSIILPICLLAGYGIETIVLAGLKKNTQDLEDNTTPQHSSENGKALFPNRISAIFIGYLFVHSLIFGSLFLLDSPSTIEALSKADREAMEWVRNNTSKESIFLVLTPYSNWETNQRMEWFPAIADRKSVLTVQGTEWLSNNQFSRQQDIYEKVNKCVMENIKCINEMTSQEGITFTYIYISGTLTDRLTGYESPLPIENALLLSKTYTLIYEDSSIRIFRKSDDI